MSSQPPMAMARSSTATPLTSEIAATTAPPAAPPRAAPPQQFVVGPARPPLKKGGKTVIAVDDSLLDYTGPNSIFKNRNRNVPVVPESGIFGADGAAAIAEDGAIAEEGEEDADGEEAMAHENEAVAAAIAQPSSSSRGATTPRAATPRATAATTPRTTTSSPRRPATARGPLPSAATSQLATAAPLRSTSPRVGMSPVAAPQTVRGLTQQQQQQSSTTAGGATTPRTAAAGTSGASIQKSGALRALEAESAHKQHRNKADMSDAKWREQQRMVSAAYRERNAANATQLALAEKRGLVAMDRGDPSAYYHPTASSHGHGRAGGGEEYYYDEEDDAYYYYEGATTTIPTAAGHGLTPKQLEQMYPYQNNSQQKFPPLPNFSPSQFVASATAASSLTPRSGRGGSKNNSVRSSTGTVSVGGTTTSVGTTAERNGGVGVTSPTMGPHTAANSGRTTPLGVGAGGHPSQHGVNGGGLFLSSDDEGSVRQLSNSRITSHSNTISNNNKAPSSSGGGVFRPRFGDELMRPDGDASDDQHEGGAPATMEGEGGYREDAPPPSSSHHHLNARRIAVNKAMYGADDEDEDEPAAVPPSPPHQQRVSVTYAEEEEVYAETHAAEEEPLRIDSDDNNDHDEGGDDTAAAAAMSFGAFGRQPTLFRTANSNTSTTPDEDAEVVALTNAPPPNRNRADGGAAVGVEEEEEADAENHDQHQYFAAGEDEDDMNATGSPNTINYDGLFPADAEGEGGADDSEYQFHNEGEEQGGGDDDKSGQAPLVMEGRTLPSDVSVTYTTHSHPQAANSNGHGGGVGTSTPLPQQYQRSYTSNNTVHTSNGSIILGTIATSGGGGVGSGVGKNFTLTTSGNKAAAAKERLAAALLHMASSSADKTAAAAAGDEVQHDSGDNGTPSPSPSFMAGHITIKPKSLQNQSVSAAGGPMNPANATMLFDHSPLPPSATGGGSGITSLLLSDGRVTHTAFANMTRREQKRWMLAEQQRKEGRRGAGGGHDDDGPSGYEEEPYVMTSSDINMSYNAAVTPSLFAQCLTAEEQKQRCEELLQKLLPLKQNNKKTSKGEAKKEGNNTISPLRRRLGEQQQQHQKSALAGPLQPPQAAHEHWSVDRLIVGVEVQTTTVQRPLTAYEIQQEKVAALLRGRSAMMYGGHHNDNDSSAGPSSLNNVSTVDRNVSRLSDPHHISGLDASALAEPHRQRSASFSPNSRQQRRKGSVGTTTTASSYRRGGSQPYVYTGGSLYGGGDAAADYDRQHSAYMSSTTGSILPRGGAAPSPTGRSPVVTTKSLHEQERIAREKAQKAEARAFLLSQQQKFIPTSEMARNDSYKEPAWMAVERKKKAAAEEEERAQKEEAEARKKALAEQAYKQWAKKKDALGATGNGNNTKKAGSPKKKKAKRIVKPRATSEERAMEEEERSAVDDGDEDEEGEEGDDEDPDTPNFVEVPSEDVPPISAFPEAEQQPQPAAAESPRKKANNTSALGAIMTIQQLNAYLKGLLIGCEGTAASSSLSSSSSNSAEAIANACPTVYPLPDLMLRPIRSGGSNKRSSGSSNKGGATSASAPTSARGAAPPPAMTVKGLKKLSQQQTDDDNGAEQQHSAAAGGEDYDEVDHLLMSATITPTPSVCVGDSTTTNANDDHNNASTSSSAAAAAGNVIPHEHCAKAHLVTVLKFLLTEVRKSLLHQGVLLLKETYALDDLKGFIAQPVRMKGPTATAAELDESDAQNNGRSASVATASGVGGGAHWYSVSGVGTSGGGGPRYYMEEEGNGAAVKPSPSAAGSPASPSSTVYLFPDAQTQAMALKFVAQYDANKALTAATNPSSSSSSAQGDGASAVGVAASCVQTFICNCVHMAASSGKKKSGNNSTSGSRKNGGSSPSTDPSSASAFLFARQLFASDPQGALEYFNEQRSAALRAVYAKSSSGGASAAVNSSSNSSSSSNSAVPTVPFYHLLFDDDALDATVNMNATTGNSSTTASAKPKPSTTSTAAAASMVERRLMQLILAKLAKDAFLVRPAKAMEDAFGGGARRSSSAVPSGAATPRNGGGASHQQSQSQSQSQLPSKRYHLDAADVNRLLLKIVDREEDNYLQQQAQQVAGGGEARSPRPSAAKAPKPLLKSRIMMAGYRAKLVNGGDAGGGDMVMDGGNEDGDPSPLDLKRKSSSRRSGSSSSSSKKAVVDAKNIDIAVLRDYQTLLNALYTCATPMGGNRIVARSSLDAKEMLFGSASSSASSAAADSSTAAASAFAANGRRNTQPSTANSAVFRRFVSICFILRRLLIGACPVEEKAFAKFTPSSSNNTSGDSFAATSYANPFFENSFALAKAAIAAGLGNGGDAASSGEGAPLSPWVLPSLLHPTYTTNATAATAEEDSISTPRSKRTKGASHHHVAAANTTNTSMALLEAVYIPLLASYLLENDGDFSFEDDDDEDDLVAEAEGDEDDDDDFGTAANIIIGGGDDARYDLTRLSVERIEEEDFVDGDITTTTFYDGSMSLDASPVRLV